MDHEKKPFLSGLFHHSNPHHAADAKAKAKARGNDDPFASTAPVAAFPNSKSAGEAHPAEYSVVSPLEVYYDDLCTITFDDVEDLNMHTDARIRSRDIHNATLRSNGEIVKINNYEHLATMLSDRFGKAKSDTIIRKIKMNLNTEPDFYSPVSLQQAPPIAERVDDVPSAPPAGDPRYNHGGYDTNEYKSWYDDNNAPEANPPGGDYQIPEYKSVYD